MQGSSFQKPIRPITPDRERRTDRHRTKRNKQTFAQVRKIKEQGYVFS